MNLRALTLTGVSISICSAFVPRTQIIPKQSFLKSTEVDLKEIAISKLPQASELPTEYEEARISTMSLILSSKIPGEMEGALSHFLTEYFIACSQNPNMTPQSTSHRFLEAIKMTMKYGLPPNSFKFTSSHDALRGGEEENPEGDYDFYQFGCDFMYSCINEADSVLIGEENIKQAFEYIQKGENVVFLANHQTEADPQVVSHFFSNTDLNMPEEGASIIYVAGHKVTTDPLAIPFSMGRNLLCIHSKKHINSEPELKSKKMEQNLQTMSQMTRKLKQGGTCLWVAPSGGRDRRDVETGKVPIAPFDQKTVDMFRLLGNKSKKPTHFYTMAMVTYDMCPPPDSTVSSVGEERNIRYVPVGIAVSKELQNIGGVESRHLFTEHAEEVCRTDYEKLLELIANKSENTN